MEGVAGIALVPSLDAPLRWVSSARLCLSNQLRTDQGLESRNSLIDSWSCASPVE